MTNKVKLFVRSVRFSLSLIYRSSGLLVVVYLLLSLSGSLLGLLSTYSLRYLLNAAAGEEVVFQGVLPWIGVYILVLLLVQGSESFRNILYDTVFQKAEYQYEYDLAEKMAGLSMSVLDSSAGRDMQDDVRYSRNTAVYLTYRLVMIFTLACSFGVAFATLFRFSPGFSLLFLGLTVPGILLSNVFDKRADVLRRRQAPDLRKFSYYRWMLTDPWPAKDVRMYDLTAPIQARYEEVKEEYLAANRRLDRERLFALLAAELVGRAGELLFTIYVIHEALLGHIGIGDVALYIGFALTAWESFRNMATYCLFAWVRTTEVMGRVFDFYGMEEEHSRGTKKLAAFQSLEFDNVYFKYPHTDRYVLSGASFSLQQGEKLSIVGANGSGKSTIIKLMLGFYEPDAGLIRINGSPLSSYDIREVRKHFSALFQDFVQYPVSLRDNIALSDYGRQGRDGEIEESLRASGVYGELQEKLNYGLDSYMTREFDDQGTELSRGQWQKVALSRAYFKNADILIFDEPSAALDAEAEERIFRNFEEISNGNTGIMISHRISASKLTDRIIVLDGGRISESGTHEELLGLGGLYAKFYNLQKEKYTVGEGAE